MTRFVTSLTPSSHPASLSSSTRRITLQSNWNANMDSGCLSDIALQSISVNGEYLFDCRRKVYTFDWWMTDQKVFKLFRIFIESNLIKSNLFATQKAECWEYPTDSVPKNPHSVYEVNRKSMAASLLVEFPPYFCFRFGLWRPVPFGHFRGIFAYKSYVRHFRVVLNKNWNILHYFWLLSNRKSASDEPKVVSSRPNGYR